MSTGMKVALGVIAAIILFVIVLVYYLFRS